MPESYQTTDSSPSDRGLVSIQGFAIGDLDYPDLRQLTIKEIVLGENILTPGLQTAITFQNSIYLPSGKWFDRMKGQPVRFTLSKDWGGDNYSLALSGQIAYRLDNRSFKPVNVAHIEEFTLHACDNSLLNDARSLVSKSWKCTSPGDVVDHVLRNCCGVQNLDLESGIEPNRDYIAENIHPFQVVNQQSSVALYQGIPDFVHFMTYGWDSGGSTPTHHFRSVASLCDKGAMWHYRYADTGMGRDGNPVLGDFNNKESVISFEFPCDFDYLTDILNGLENGNQNTVATLNPFSKSMSTYGNNSSGCGIGGYNYKIALTNMGTAKDQNSCNLDVEQHLLKRQARMSLLDRDRIALRMVVPWNPLLHVGKVIGFHWSNKYEPEKSVYGEGDYLITGLTHVIRTGGFSTTAIDCVSNTVGQGEA